MQSIAHDLVQGETIMVFALMRLDADATASGAFSERKATADQGRKPLACRREGFVENMLSFGFAIMSVPSETRVF